MISPAFARTLVGFSAAALGCICGGLGDVFIRHSFMSEDNKPEDVSLADFFNDDDIGCVWPETRLEKLRRWLHYPVVRKTRPAKLYLSKVQTWLLGMAFACIGNPLLIVLGLALAPASLVISLSAFSLAGSVAFATWINGEGLAMGAVGGCMLIVVGLLGMLVSFSGGGQAIPAYTAASTVLTTKPGITYIGAVVGITGLVVWMAMSESGSAAICRLFGEKFDATLDKNSARSKALVSIPEIEMNSMPRVTTDSPIATDSHMEYAPLSAARQIVIVRDSAAEVPSASHAVLLSKAAAAISAGIASGHAELGGKALTSAIETVIMSLPVGNSILESAKGIIFDHGVIITIVVLALILGIDVILLNLCLRKGEAVIVVPMRNATNMITGTLGGMLILWEVPDFPVLLAASFAILLMGAIIVPMSQTERRS